MPREGTKTLFRLCIQDNLAPIEIRYAPGGDENMMKRIDAEINYIEIRYAPGGDENLAVVLPPSILAD